LSPDRAQLGAQNGHMNTQVRGRSDHNLSRNLSDLSEKIDWSETNCAWGQVALLINALLTKFSLSNSSITIVPMGPWSYIETGTTAVKDTLPLYHSATNWVSYFKKNDVKYIEACIKVVDLYEFICKEAMHLEYKEGSKRSNSSSRLHSKWSNIRKSYSEKKYSEAGYALLKNVAVILASDKLN